MLNQATVLESTKRFIPPVDLPQTDRSARNRSLDDIWLEEAEKRLAAYREGRLEGIPMEEIFVEE